MFHQSRRKYQKRLEVPLATPAPEAMAPGMTWGGIMRRIILASLACLCAPAFAQNLVNIAEADNGDQLFVDRLSLRTVPPHRDFRPFIATQIWATNQVKASRRSPQRTEQFLFSFNCAARTSVILVYRNNRTGTRLQDWHSADLDFKYQVPRPGSLAEFSMMFACSGGRLPVVPRNVTGEDEDSEPSTLEGPGGGAAAPRN